MKDKLKARLKQMIRDPFSQGVLVGSAMGCVAVTVALKQQRTILLQHFETTLNIPDDLVESILESGLPALLTRQDGAQLSIGPS